MENVKGTRSLLRRLDSIAKFGEDELDEWVPRAVAHAKVLHQPHKKTGDTARSIQPGPRRKGEASVEAAGAAVFLEFGTEPHTIVPRRARMLAWPRSSANRRLSGAARSGTSSGDMIFARRVNHPGTKPAPFLVPGAERAREEVFGRDEIIRRWNKAG